MFILDQLTGSKQDLDGTVVCHVCRYSTECRKVCVQVFVFSYGLWNRIVRIRILGIKKSIFFLNSTMAEVIFDFFVGCLIYVFKYEIYQFE